MPRRRRSISRWALAVVAALLSTATVLVAPVPAEAAAPPAPSSVTLTAGRRQVKVDWTAPQSPGGTITSYKATVAPAPGECTTGGSTYTCTISAVTANTTLTVSVQACISADCSPAKTATTRVGPPATPQAPTASYTVTTPDQKSMHLTWGENDLGAGVSSYRVTSTPAFTTETGTCIAPVLWPATSCDVGDLKAATSYSFKLTAIGVSFPAPIGSTGSSAVGPASTPKYTGVPPTPDEPDVTRTSDTAVKVTWAKPTGEGAAVGGYTVRKTVDSATTQACAVNGPDTTTCDVSGLSAAKSYTFAVTANGEGTYGGASGYGGESDPITPGKPAQPDTPTVELGASVGQVTVSWTAPEGGGTIIKYRVNAIPADQDVAIPPPCETDDAIVTHCDFKTLENGKAYTFTVTAVGAVDSDASPASDSIVSELPAAADAPTVTLGAAPGSVQLNWDKPDTGGQIVYYNVKAIPAPDSAALGHNSGDCGFNLAAPSCTITGLDSTASYTFVVTSVGDLGTADSPASDPVVPDQPGEATILGVALDSSTQATVTWSEPTTGGVVDKYKVTATPTDGTTAPTPCTVLADEMLTCTFSTLDATKSYKFTVTAHNNSGDTDAKADPTDIPAAPTDVTWTLGGSAGNVTVQWSPSETGAGASSFVVTSTAKDGGTGPGCSSDGASCAITGLTASKSYTFTVHAQNILGGKDSTASTAVIPAAPGQPTGASAKATASGQVTVSWVAPTAGGTIDHYVVTPDPDSACNNVAAGATQCLVTGLGATTHTFTVTAVNNITTTPSTATGSVVAAAPNAATSVTAKLGDTPGKVIIDWVGPTTGGTVTSYAVIQTVDTATSTPVACNAIKPTTTTCTLTGLSTTGSYTFVVRAKNDVDTADSEPTDAIVPDTPAAPTSLQVLLGVAQPGKVTVKWLDSVGGGAVDHYQVVAKTGGLATAFGCSSVAPGVQTCVITGLDRTKAYKFVVSSVNDAGPATATSGEVVPDQPGAPQNVKATADETPGTVTVTWEKPGGGAPASYEVVVVSADGFKPEQCDVAGGEPLTCTFDHLTEDATYQFTVSAINASGTSTAESTAPLIPNKPGVPDMVKGEVTAVDTVRLTWQAPKGNGGPLASYYATAYATDAPTVAIPSESCAEVTETTCLFTGLDPNKTYKFTVTSVGPGGAKSDESQPTYEITTAPPAPPPVPDVELAGANAVRVTWAGEPESGGPVLAWSVKSDPKVPQSGDCVMTDKPGCVFTGLTSGVPYRFTVTAHGTADRDASGEASEPIVPGPPDTPARPTVKATANAGEVTVSWTAPDAGAGIAGYQVQSSPGLIGCAKSAGPDDTSCLVSGLTVGVSYKFRVQALGVDGSGDSALSPSSDPIVPQAPGRPTNVDVVGGDRQIAVSWTAPDLTGRVAYYVATATPGGATCQTKTNVDTECVITGLQNATVYTVVVTAVGTTGLGNADSRASTRVRPTAGIPGSPTGVGAKGGDGSAVVTWTAPAPADTGDGIARYYVAATDGKGGGKTCLTPDGSTLTCTITGLTNLQKYTVTVVSIGKAASGNSRPSTGVDVTPSAAPGAPTGVKVTPGSKTLEVIWAAGSAGSGIGGFTATAIPTTGSPTPFTCGPTDKNATTCSIANVTPGTAYDVTVVAAGVVAGVTSAASDKVTATAILQVAPGVGIVVPSLPAGTLTVTAVGSPTAATSVKLGASLVITGTGYATYTGVSIGLFPGAVSLATAVTDSTGKFSVTVPITGVPANTKATIVAGGLLPTAVKYKTAAITVLPAP